VLKGHYIAIVLAVAVFAGIMVALADSGCLVMSWRDSCDEDPGDVQTGLNARGVQGVSAHGLPGTVTISWDDLYEDAIAAHVVEFRVYRRDLGTGARDLVGRAAPHAKGEGPYSLLDTTAVAGQTYVYGVSEVNLNNESEVLEAPPLVAQ
jgi:hypothetical protein